MGSVKWSWRIQRLSWGHVKGYLLGREEESLLEEDPVGEFLSCKDEGIYQLEDEEVREEAQTTLESQETGAEKEDTDKLGPAPMSLEQSSEEQEPIADDLATGAMDEAEDEAVGLRDEAEEMAETDAGTRRALEGESEEAAEAVYDSTGSVEVEGESLELTAAHDELKVADTESPGTEAPTSGDVDPQIFEMGELEVEVAESSDDELQAEEEKEHRDEVSFSPQSEEAQEDEDVDGMLEIFRSEPLSENPISVLSQELGDTDVYSLLEETRKIADKVKDSS